MKNIFKPRLFISLAVIALSVVIIIISYKFIKIDSAITNLLPKDEKMERSIALTARSPISDKLVLYVETVDEKDLKHAIDLINEEISKFEPGLKSGIPETEDINEIMEYCQQTSLLLYPYEFLKNPFTIAEVDRRLKSKEIYLESNPFFSGSEGFFLDPLMTGFDVLKLAYSSTGGKYSPQYGGVISENKKAYIRIFKGGFPPDNYGMSKNVFDLDSRIMNIASKNNFISFLYGAQLFYYDSYRSITTEVGIIFVLSILITFLIFFLFFRKISLLIYSSVPIVVSFAVTFLVIAVFKKSFVGIAFAFGSTTAGIAIDYIIIYLMKLNVYPSLKILRKKMWLSMFLGYITTALAFVILFFSKINSLQEIALFGIVSVTVSFFTSWFLLQNLIKPENFSFSLKKIKFEFGTVYLFIAWCIISAVFVAGIFFTRIEDRLTALDKEHPFMQERLKIFQKNFNESTDSVFLCFTGKDRDEILDNSLEAYKAVRKENPDLTFFTPAIFYPPERIIKERKDFIKGYFSSRGFLYYLNRSNFDNKAFDSWLAGIKDIDNLTLPLPPEYVKQESDSMFVNYSGRDFLLIHIPSRTMADEITRILTKQNKIGFFIVDTLTDSAKGLVDFETKTLILLYISLGLIFLILLIVYRNPLDAFMAILPSLIGVVACFSIARFTGRGFNIMHLASSILIIGIGVDYGIHTVAMYRDRHFSEEMNSTMQAILICALSTVAVFGVLSISSNQAVFSLGTSMLAGTIMSFLTAYCAVPFFMNFKKKKTK